MVHKCNLVIRSCINRIVVLYVMVIQYVGVVRLVVVGSRARRLSADIVI